jgi:hypothetical protein
MIEEHSDRRFHISGEDHVNHQRLNKRCPLINPILKQSRFLMMLN